MVTCQQLHNDAAQAPHVAGVGPAHAHDNLWGTVVAGGHNATVVLLLEGGAPEVNQLSSTSGAAGGVGVCEHALMQDIAGMAHEFAQGASASQIQTPRGNRDQMWGKHAPCSGAFRGGAQLPTSSCGKPALQAHIFHVLIC